DDELHPWDQEHMDSRNIVVSHEVGTGKTVVERTALDIPFVRIVVDDPDTNLLRALYGKLAEHAGMSSFGIVGFREEGEPFCNFVGGWGGFLAKLAGQQPIPRADGTFDLFAGMED
ncbi:MAG: hypothetical protein V1492_04400, partial [Candidatus Micrarchaeota archaeon]